MEDYPVTPDDEPILPESHNRRWVVVGIIVVAAVLAFGLFVLKTMS